MTADPVSSLAPDAVDTPTDGDLQERLRQAQKMEAVGQLAAGVAHDFNNLLTVILGSCHFLLDDLGNRDDRMRQEVLEIQSAGRKAAALTQQLLAFSRKQPLAPEILDPNALVSNAVELLRRTVGEHVTIRTALRPGCGSCEADPHQLEQVLLNLVVNARDAMPKGGTITITTGRVVFDLDIVRRKPGSVPGTYVTIAVSDTGIGMAPETQRRIFEPFFTTKQPGVGTGLGLATVLGIVKQSNGYIDVESRLGQGSTFTVCLPLVEGSASSIDHEAPVTAEGGCETVLLVEDEEPVRSFVRKVLLRAGYRVLEARDGEQAAHLAKIYDREIDLLITDVVMPRRSGKELADELVAQGRKVDVLYMSGHTDQATVRHGVTEGIDSFLRKPFTPEALLAAVRSALGRGNEVERGLRHPMAAAG